MREERGVTAYKLIDGFSAYRVGDDGSVWSRWLRVGLGNGGGTRMVLGDEWFRMETKLSTWSGRRMSPTRKTRSPTGRYGWVSDMGARG